VNCTSDLPNAFEGDGKVAYYRFEAWLSETPGLMLHNAFSFFFRTYELKYHFFLDDHDPCFGLSGQRFSDVHFCLFAMQKKIKMAPP